MEKYKTFTGVVAPLDKNNIDTDAIIPKQYLKSISRTGFGVNLFDEWRYLDSGEPGQDHSKRKINTEFILNRKPFNQASILLTGDNFGCGSSREHAAWAIKDFGINAIIAKSFADIFYNNCFKNGILPVVLPQDQVDILMRDAEKGANSIIEVDLENQTIASSDGEVFIFEVDPFKKHCLLNGLDDIGLTMEKEDQITAYETKAAQMFPWA